VSRQVSNVSYSGIARRSPVSLPAPEDVLEQVGGVFSSWVGFVDRLEENVLVTRPGLAGGEAFRAWRRNDSDSWCIDSAVQGPNSAGASVVNTRSYAATAS